MFKKKSEILWIKVFDLRLPFWFKICKPISSDEDQPTKSSISHSLVNYFKLIFGGFICNHDHSLCMCYDSSNEASLNLPLHCILINKSFFCLTLDKKQKIMAEISIASGS